MMGRLVRRRPSLSILARLERPEVALLAIALAAVAAVGWLGPVFWLQVAVAGQLALGGLGGVWVIGPATARLGFARYATLAAAGVSLTLFGRSIATDGGVILIPIAAILLWGVLRLELELNRTGRGGWLLDLALVGIVFAAAAGLTELLPGDAWPAILVLGILLAAIPSLRAAESRGRYGVHAVGQAILHLLLVAQVLAAVLLLDLPPLVAAALAALAFHAWGGAAESIERGSPGRAVVVEFGALAVLGLVVALFLRG